MKRDTSFPGTAGTYCTFLMLLLAMARCRFADTFLMYDNYSAAFNKRPSADEKATMLDCQTRLLKLQD